MKQGEIIITAILVIAAFTFGFLNNTNSSPKLDNTPTNSTLNVDGSSTNEEQSLMMMKFNLEKNEVMEIDSLSTDSIVQDSTQIIIED